MTRVEIPLARASSDPRRVVLRDETFDGRAGWKAIVAAPGEGTAVRSTAPSGDPTNGLRAYPEESLSSPLDQRRATLRGAPGRRHAGGAGGPRRAATTTTSRGGSDGFAGVFSDAASGEGVLLLLLLAAFGWGALHALSPGHGKAMVAAYLIGTRGTPRHAVALGAIVTFTHTIGVFALGLVTLLLSQYILPEDLYPWLNLASGLLVVIVGVGVLRSRVRWARARRAGEHDHSHDDHDHHHHHHGHCPRSRPHHHHHVPDQVTWKGLIAMGAAAGLIPCPSALVVLLGAIAQHQVALGLLLIVAFSAGLAMTLTALGLAVVFGRRALSRVLVPAGVTAALPALSAVVIVGVGFVLTAQGGSAALLIDVGSPAMAERSRGIDELLERARADGVVPGVVAMVADRDGLIYEGTAGASIAGDALDRDTLFRIASMTKALTSVAALQLIEQGRLALDQTVDSVLPEFGALQLLEGFDGDEPRLRQALAQADDPAPAHAHVGTVVLVHEPGPAALARGHQRPRSVQRLAQVPRHAVRRRAGRAVGVRRQHRVAGVGRRGGLGPDARVIHVRARLRRRSG